MQRGGCVYIMTNQNNSVLYTGVSSDLMKRVLEHKEKIHPKSFTAKYNIEKLVYYEFHQTIEEAISREKQIKAGSRGQKEELICTMNREWRDLFSELT